MIGRINCIQHRFAKFILVECAREQLSFPREQLIQHDIITLSTNNRTGFR